MEPHPIKYECPFKVLAQPMLTATDFHGASPLGLDGQVCLCTGRVPSRQHTNATSIPDGAHLLQVASLEASTVALQAVMAAGQAGVCSRVAAQIEADLVSGTCA